MLIKAFRSSHVGDAISLVLGGYAAERAAVPALPQENNCLRALTGELEGLAAGGSGLPGFAAVEGGRLLGFLAGYPTESFFSTHKGVYIPACGHGAAGPDRRLVYQRLYEAASGTWVGEGRLVHALSFFAHDAQAQDAWYWLGFGLRCVDAVRPLSPVEGVMPSGLEIRKALPDDAEELFPLHAEHCRYYRNPPLFMPHVELESDLLEFRQWLAGEDHHLWAAWSGGVPASYIRIERGGGNSFAFRNPQTYNICGAFTAEAARRSGAGALLLSAIVEWTKGLGCERLGVDYESFNIYGSRFWGKHFTPFLLSPVRSIDDRMLPQ